MSQPNTLSLRVRCLWTAYRLEHHWKKLSRLQKQTSGSAIHTTKDLLCLERKIGREMALIHYFQQVYQLYVKGADHPERLAI